MPPSKRPAPEPAKPTKGPSLTALRAEIDRLDKELVALLNKRSEISVQIGQIKHATGQDVFSAAREDEVLARVNYLNKGPLLESTLRAIFRELMSGSRALQRPMRVACLGPKYSYSHLASVAKFGESIEHVPVDSIAAVFEEVNRRHVQFGIVPLENSTDGRIADTLDMFKSYLGGVRIRAEVRFRIHHCLLSKGEQGQIRRVYSKAQVLSQCRHWLSKHLPQASLIPVVSSAAAAEFASREESAAAVASRAAGEAHRLNMLAANIEDQPHNLTRFAVIGEKSELRSGKDKTTLMLRLPNTAGALVKAIAPLEKSGVNMTWIESFPTSEDPKNGHPTYLFFLDIEGHADDPEVQKTLEQVRKRCEKLEILGSYPRSETIEG